MWAAGCILAELANHSPLWAGENDIDQLSKIMGSLGTICLDDYPEVSHAAHAFALMHA